ncbi:hypothetical protein LJC25_03870 [Bacteroidales bacterium OttesenSCG-928-K03]|nr:hypothetical protein [Bacteroidales bacterium OttesenSCG-928-K22]MDL2242846.1 hypothetical protein [Bacteroidales bacterium OttesenSCG-928-K03]
MIVHKFGGASVKDAESIRRIPSLLKSMDNERAFIVISAMGKTTNKLEVITNAAFEGNSYLVLFDSLKDEHLAVYDELQIEGENSRKELIELFANCLNVIETTAKDNYSFFYDQVVSYGERFSSLILEKYLNHSGFDVKLLDAGKLFSADDNWRAGNINHSLTEWNISNAITGNDNDFLITQGFIAGNGSGDYLTLGREGSDYSAALVAVYSNASEIIFWKDVDGIYSSDPNVEWRMENGELRMENGELGVVKIEKMSYSEMIELSFFGAKVLHEKALFALQDKNIKMQVRSFLDIHKSGTCFYNNYDEKYPSIKIISENQILYTCEPHERAIINSNHIKYIYDCANECNVNISLIQMSALKISFCVDFDEFACDRMLHNLEKKFKVKYNNDIILVTLRHYSPNDIAEFENAKNIILSQVSRVVAQYVIVETHGRASVREK